MQCDARLYPIIIRYGRYIPLFGMLFLLTACAGGERFQSPYAAGYYASSPMQCVPYARQQSGIQLYGDAHTWWYQAEPRYRRSYYPSPGSVLVLSRTPRMTHGHLAVVRRVINNRQIDVTHSNWGSDSSSRRVIYQLMRVEDVSPQNNWSMVRFWNKDIGSFGFPYATSGFISR